MVLSSRECDSCNNLTHLLERIYYANKPRVRFYFVSQIIKFSSQITDEEIAIKAIKSIDIDFIALLIKSNGLFTLIGLQLIQILTVSKHCVKVLDSLRPLIALMLKKLLDKINIENESIDEDMRNDLITNAIDCLSIYYKNIPYHRFCDLSAPSESRTAIIQILFNEIDSENVNVTENNDVKYCPYCDGSKTLSTDNCEFDNLLDNNDEYDDLDDKWQMETFNNIVKSGNIMNNELIITITNAANYLLDRIDNINFHKTISNCAIMLFIGDIDTSKKCIELLLKYDLLLAITCITIISDDKNCKKKNTLKNYKQYINAILATELSRKDLSKLFLVISDNFNIISSIDEILLLTNRAYAEIFVIIEDIMRSSKSEIPSFDMFPNACNIIEKSMLYLDKLENESFNSPSHSPLDIQDFLIDEISSISTGINSKQMNMGKISQLFKIFHDTVILFFDYFNFIDEKYTKVVGLKKDIIRGGARLVGCWMYLEPLHLQVQFKRVINIICKIFDWDDFLWLLPAIDNFESHELCDYQSLIYKLIESFYHISIANSDKNKDFFLPICDYLKKICIIINRIYLDTFVEPKSLLFNIDKIISSDDLDKLYHDLIENIDLSELNKDFVKEIRNYSYSPIKLGDIYYENPLQYIPIPYNHIMGHYIDLYRMISKLTIILALTLKDSDYISLIASTCISILLVRDENDSEINEKIKDFLYINACKGLLSYDEDIFVACLNTSIVMSAKCNRFKSILDTTLYHGNVPMDTSDYDKLISYKNTIIP